VKSIGGFIIKPPVLLFGSFGTFEGDDCRNFSSIPDNDSNFLLIRFNEYWTRGSRGIFRATGSTGDDYFQTTVTMEFFF
jgi:hypothetical protein